MSDPFTLSPELFGLFSHLIEQRTGIYYGAENRELLASKLCARALDAGFAAPIDYYYKLRYDDPGEAEFTALVEAIVVGETYFFRESNAIEVLVDRYLSPIVSAGGRPRVWSAACATGEEPLTVAMLLDERGILDGVEIVATDISERALRVAREGRYRSRSLRALPSRAATGRWIAIDGDVATVSPSLLRRIDLRRTNLVDEAAVRRLGRFDLVLCRNVLIYFGDLAAAKVVASLSESLTPNGVIAVGIAESLLRFGTGLECRELGGVFVYRKARR